PPGSELTGGGGAARRDRLLDREGVRTIDGRADLQGRAGLRGGEDRAGDVDHVEGKPAGRPRLPVARDRVDHVLEADASHLARAAGAVRMHLPLPTASAKPDGLA